MMRPYNLIYQAIIGLPLLMLSTGAAAVLFESTHTFSVRDIQGGEQNLTYENDQTVICGLADSVYSVCPDDAMQPIIDNDGNTLYPVENNFGFIVSDFVGAADRTFDSDYAEGYAGDVYDDEYGEGVAVANNATQVFKTRDAYGTWCSGVGGVTVKCSSEHYVVMEHVLSCNETVPYTTDGEPRLLYKPGSTEVVGSCLESQLDDALYIVRDSVVSDELLLLPSDQLEPNESTVRNDIAVGGDYSVTLKDDGKPLYRWGNAIKRPIDIRIYARMALPPEWNENPDIAYEVKSATLSVTHTITNNPNDQIRPEDMENEGATGRLPAYTVSGDDWVSAIDCYEGDGDFIPAGTLFKNSSYADADAFSEDLSEGMTNAWYTSTNRDPFEAVESVVGPRWRLKGNKYGQDVPSLEIANSNTECTVPPPFANGAQKYEVGSVTVTTIDLLDFEGESPLATSQGWIDASKNSVNLGEGGEESEPNGVSVNKLPLTEGFDLAIYVKGDKKSVKIYNAVLNIDWEEPELEPEPEPVEP